LSSLKVKMGALASNIKSLRELVQEKIAISQVKPTTAAEWQLAKSMENEAKIAIVEAIEKVIVGINLHLTSILQNILLNYSTKVSIYVSICDTM
jgi:hypothetical protein